MSPASKMKKMDDIGNEFKERLIRLASALVDQQKATVIIAAKMQRPGFWFGAGNVVEDKAGNFHLTGRYRNAGDSRTGLQAGERGAELAFFKSEDRGETFTKIFSFSKSDFNDGKREVISIEGSGLHFVEDGIELYVSVEKSGIAYPEGLEEYRKPGTGIWSIALIKASSIERLKEESPAKKLRSLFETKDPRFLHVKDPVVFDVAGGSTVCVFCTHPFSWASSNAGYIIRSRNALTRRGPWSFEAPSFDFFQRGVSWDVAISRITGVLHVPHTGAFSALPSLTLYFYDGGEAMRRYEEHPMAVKRPRGYSCEEIGGLAWGADREFPKLQRLSPYVPLFTSPYGTGSSRYVTTLQTREGIFAFWQQSQKDLSQPFMMNFLSRKEILRILS